MIGVRKRIEVRGIVQGVGFRPFVYRIAKRCDVRGWVLNSSDGVVIEAEGGDVGQFLTILRTELPPLARIDRLLVTDHAPLGDLDFVIQHSVAVNGRFALVPPDVATCADCAADFTSPENRRYGYPFTNCTNCGPRYTIIRDVPYDRSNTTMAEFRMCARCQAEYEDPLNRRFHAEPNACPDCGPSLALLAGEELASGAVPVFAAGHESMAILGRARQLLREGRIVAIKGLGGFHIACDAANEVAVSLLRERKRRSGKAFAIMVRSLEAAERFCMVTAADRALLEGPRRPIVLLPRRADSAVAQSVAPGNARLGAMLPYTPLHHLLLDESIEALVMTSGNMSEEPIVSRNEEAWPRLHTLADYFLLHNRAIRTRVDDSVFQIFEGREYPVRRSRGYAPDPIEMGTVEKYPPLVFFVTFRDPQGHDSTLEKHLSPYGGPRECQGRRIANPPQVNNLPHVDPAFFITVGGPEAHQGRSEICPTGLPEVLACGGELKNTFCLIKEPYAILSQHIGDLENLETMEFFRETLEHLRRFFRVTPVAVAHDLHPGYLSTRFALNESGLPAIGVQHHHAHIASCMADNGIEGKVIGVALDGTGYGTDGMIWGGEFLVADFLDFERCGHLRYVPLAGGDSGVRQPWRSALAYLRDAFGENARSLPLALFREVPAKHLRVVEAMIARNIQTVATSSCGRLFDAVSSLLGIRHETSYEGQAAIELEAAASSCSGSYPFAIEDGAPFQVDLRTLIEAIVRDSTDGVATGEISARFHLTMANVIAACCERVRQSHGLTRVCLSGGTFQNLRLLSHTTALLREQGFDVFTHHQVPTNDGGLALGQALIAAKVAAHRSFL